MKDREVCTTPYVRSQQDLSGGVLVQMVDILGIRHQSTLDLHRLSAAEARASVLCALLSLQSAAKAGMQPEADLTIITGTCQPAKLGQTRAACLSLRRLSSCSHAECRGWHTFRGRESKVAPCH